MTVFRKRWWRIGIADPRIHRRISGWKWLGSHLWWKTNKTSRESDRESA